MGKFQPLTGLKKNAITWEFSAWGKRTGIIFIVVRRGSTNAFTNFQPGLKIFSDCLVKFSARLGPTGLKISPCNRNVNF